jgi:alanine racemase
MKLSGEGALEAASDPIAPIAALHRPNRVEIDLDALAHNAATIRGLVGPQVKVWAALKANAYGFGLDMVAKTVLGSGADAVAVGDVAAGVQLRRSGVKCPILVYAGCLLASPTIEAVHAHSLILTLPDIAAARRASALAVDPVKVFIKIDSGLERLGLDPADAGEQIMAIAQLPRLVVEGLYTHLHVPSACPAGYARWQFERFDRVVMRVRTQGLKIPLAMAASSAVLSISRAMNLNAVDPGRLFYGLVPPGEELAGAEFRPVLSAIKTRLAQVKTLTRSEFVELAPYPVRGGMRIGILPFGRADGFNHIHCGEVLVRGRRARLVGDVAIEHARIDLTDVPEAQPEDEVVVVGCQGSQVITVENVAANQRYIGQADLPLAVGSTVERVYLRGSMKRDGQGHPKRMRG